MAIVTKSGSKTSPREVLERAKAQGVEVVDVRFVDLPGTWQHFSLPLGELEVDSFTDGLGFDGSSIRGFQAIDESDMLLIPDPDSATIDPVLQHKTLFLICDVIDPITREPYSRDARLIAKKAEEHLRRSGIADVSYWGPEAEFYLFNSLRFDQNAHSGYYYIDSEEGIWNSGKNSEPNLAFRPRHKEGYFPVPPTDKFQDLRSEIMLDAFGVTEPNWRDALDPGRASAGLPSAPPDFAMSESPRYVGRAVAALAADPERARWNQRSVTSGELAEAYGFTDVDGSQPQVWRYIADSRARDASDATDLDPDEYR